MKQRVSSFAILCALFLAPLFTSWGQQVNKTMEMLPQATLAQPGDIFMVTTGVVGTARSTRGISTANVLNSLTNLAGWAAAVGQGGSNANVNISLAVPGGLTVFGVPLVNSGTMGFTANHVPGFFANDGSGVTSWSSDGSILTNLNAGALASGTVPNSRLSTLVTLQGNTFNLPNDLLQLDSSGRIPALDGSLLYNLNAGSISSGTLANARLGAQVTLQGNVFNAANDLLQLDSSGRIPALDGSQILNLNASAINSGTLTLSGRTTVAALAITNPGSGTASMMLGVGSDGKTVVTNALPSVLSCSYIPLSVGTNFYVSPGGSSGNSGLSQASPWPFGYAITNAGASNTITLMPGNYSNSVWMSSPSTQSGLVIQGLTKWTAILSGTNFCCFYALGVSNFTIQGLQLCYPTNDCIRLGAGAIGCTIQDNWIHDSAHGPGWSVNTNGSYNGSGILASPLITGMVVQRNLFEYNGAYAGSTGHNPQDHNIYFSGSNNVVRCNVFRYALGYGIQMYDGTGGTITGNKIYENLVYGNGTGAGNTGAAVTLWANSSSGTNWFYGNTVINSNAAHSIPAVLCYNGTIYLTNNLVLGGDGGDYSGSIDIISGVGYSDYNLGTNTLSASGPGTYVDGGHNRVSDGSQGINGFFVNPSNGLWWLAPGSIARSAAINQPPVVNFFGAANTSVSDVGFAQFSSIRANDNRVLDPSPVAGADYWSIFIP